MDSSHRPGSWQPGVTYPEETHGTHETVGSGTGRKLWLRTESCIRGMTHQGLCPAFQPATWDFGLVKSKKNRANRGQWPCQASVHETQGLHGTVPSYIDQEDEQGGPREDMSRLSVGSPMWSIHHKQPHISQRYWFSVSHLTAKTLSKWGRIKGYHTLVSCWKPAMETLSNKWRKYKQSSINQPRIDRFNRIRFN